MMNDMGNYKGAGEDVGVSAVPWITFWITFRNLENCPMLPIEILYLRLVSTNNLFSSVEHFNFLFQHEEDSDDEGEYHLFNSQF